MTDFKAIKCTKFDFGWGSPDTLAGFGRRFAAGGGAGLGKRRERGRGREGGGSGGEGKGGPQVTVEPGPLRDLLCHCDTSSQILMLPANIVFTM